MTDEERNISISNLSYKLGQSCLWEIHYDKFKNRAYFERIMVNVSSTSNMSIKFISGIKKDTAVTIHELSNGEGLY